LTMPAVTALQAWKAMPNSSPAAVATSSQPNDTAPADPAPPAAATSSPGTAARASVTRVFDYSGYSENIVTPSFDPWLPVLLGVWVVGVAILTLRLLTGWIWVQRVKSHGTEDAPDDWQQMTSRLARRLHISRPIRLLQSAAVEVPTVIGWLRPVVLLPVSALAGLAPHQLEAILAHELAHIRRHDYLVNLLQTLVETLLFYHPAVWWLSRRIRIERENCCDDVAVSLCGDPYTYARALANLEALRGDRTHLALAANGGSLLHRVRRLLGAPSHAGRGPGWLAASVAVVLLALIAAGAIRNNAFGSERSIEERAVLPAAPAATPEPQPVKTTAQSVPVVASPRERDTQVSLAHIAAAARFLSDALADFAGLADGFDLQPPAPPEPPLPPTPPVPPVVDEPLLPGAPLAPMAPVPPMPALAPEAPLAPEPPVDWGFSGIGQSRDSSGNFTWSDGKQKLEVSYKGALEFNDDDTDLKSLSPGGHFKLREGGLLSRRTIEFRADASGNIQRRYWVGSSEKPFDPDGRKWLAESLPRFIRQSGIGAEARVARILKAKGPAGVLAEISLIEGSWAKSRYFAELLKTPTLDSQTKQQVLSQASREVDSDFELASLLIGSADRLLVEGNANDAGVRQAYFDAAKTIQSDFEMRRVYSSALKRGPVPPDVLAGILDASTAIGSDFEEASLLMQIAKLQPLDALTRPPFFKALATVESDFEHRRVLGALGERTDLTSETVGALLDSSVDIGSDFEQASVLLAIVKVQPIEGALRAPFFRVVETIQSPFERGRVLQAVAKRPDLSAETVVAVLRAAQGMKSNFETSQVLMAMATAHPITGEARDVYIAAAGQLGDFEEGRALSALVKNERRK
jgi:beta-lactamase regulating signal transducer with metallopeptidase domain